MANEITTDGNSWKVEKTISSSSGFQKTLNTSGTFLDRNIDIDVKVPEWGFAGMSLLRTNFTCAGRDDTSGIAVGVKYYIVTSGWVNENLSTGGTVLDGYWGLTGVTVEEAKRLGINDWTWTKTDGINYITNSDSSLTVNVDELEDFDTEAF